MQTWLHLWRPVLGFGLSVVCGVDISPSTKTRKPPVCIFLESGSLSETSLNHPFSLLNGPRKMDFPRLACLWVV